MDSVAQMRHKSPQSLDVVPIKGGIVQIIAISPRRLQGVTQGAINPVGIRSLPGEQKTKLGQDFPSRSRGEISQVPLTLPPRGFAGTSNLHRLSLVR